MPPINQQGSRAGLITSLVVFAILFIVSSIFAFQYYGQLQKSMVDADAYKKRYNGIVVDTAIGSGPVEALRTSAREKPNKYNVTDNDTAMAVSLAQTAALANVIRGNAAASDSPAGPAIDEAARTVSDCQSQLKNAGITQTLPPGLDEGLKTLTTALIAANAQVASLKNDAKVAEGRRQRRQGRIGKSTRRQGCGFQEKGRRGCSRPWPPKTRK